MDRLSGQVKALVGKREGGDAMVPVSETTQYERLAVSQLARYFTDERILVANYRAARAYMIARASTQAIRKIPGSQTRENLLLYMETSLDSAKSEATGSSLGLQSGILSRVPSGRRGLVKEEGLLLAQKILREKVEHNERMSPDYYAAAKEMLTALDARLGEDSNENVAVAPKELSTHT